MPTCPDAEPTANGGQDPPCVGNGVTRNASTAGASRGPPAASAYALEPIGVLTMHPSPVDIEPAVVTKLSDRGTFQNISVVADVGSFLRELVQALQRQESC